jgi:hypothetical protein
MSCQFVPIITAVLLSKLFSTAENDLVVQIMSAEQEYMKWNKYYTGYGNKQTELLTKQSYNLKAPRKHNIEKQNSC